MQKREANFTRKFEKWARKNIPAPAVFEIKQTTTDSLPYSAIRKHQRSWLTVAMSERPACWKIPDVGSSYKPFDVIMVGTMDAYVVIQFKSGWCAIGADRFFEEESATSRKSITLPRAREISAYSGDSL